MAADQSASPPDRPPSSDNTTDVERDAGLEGAAKVHDATPPNEVDIEKQASHAPASAPLPPPPAQDGPPPAAAPENERTKFETFVVMLALCIALFLAALDMTIVTTAIPTMVSSLAGDDPSLAASAYSWIGASYLLGNASCTVAWGRLSDVFGRKQTLICAVMVFWLGSLLCAVSNSMGMLIAARGIQGVGGGGTIVLPNICVSDLFSQRKRGLYFGLLGSTWAVASGVGPVLGGVFTTKVSWRWCFYINLPLGGIALAILVFFLHLHNPRTPFKQGIVAIDWVGILLIIGGTLMLLFGLDFGGVQYSWSSATVICLIVFGAVTIGLFAVYEAFVAKYPLIPLSLFSHRTSLAAFGLSFMHAFTFMGGSYWLPLYFQAVMGATSLLSGVYLLPFVLSLSVTSTVVGIVIKKTGNYKIPIIVGLLIMTLGFGLLIDLGDDRAWAKIIIFQIIAGIGVGPNFQAPLIALQTNVEPRDIGSATASFGFLRQLGTSISVVVGGVIFNNEMQKQRDYLEAAVGPKVASMFTGSSAAGSVHAVAGLPPAVQGPVQHAYWDGLQKMYIVYTCFSAVGLLIGFFVKQKQLSKAHTEHKTGLASLKRRNEGKVAANEEAKTVV